MFPKHNTVCLNMSMTCFLLNIPRKRKFYCTLRKFTPYLSYCTYNKIDIHVTLNILHIVSTNHVI